MRISVGGRRRRRKREENYESGISSRRVIVRVRVRNRKIGEKKGAEEAIVNQV